MVSFQIALITYDRSVHFYSMPEGSSQPTQLTVSDIDGKATTKIISFPICTKLNKAMTLCNSRFTDSNERKQKLFTSRHLSAKPEWFTGEPSGESLPDHAAVGRVAEPLRRLARDGVGARSCVASGFQNRVANRYLNKTL